MLSRLASAMIITLVVAIQPPGFEVGAIIRKIDVEKRVAEVFANGQERTVRIAADVATQDESGKDLSGGLSAPELKEGATVTLRLERNGNMPSIVLIRLARKVNGLNRPPNTTNRQGQMSVGKNSVGFKPLTEMTPQDVYKGEDGGLYGGGQNEPSESLTAAAEKATSQIQPRDAAGRPAIDGTIGLVSISMSNATQEFSRFKQLADADTEKSPLVTIVDCAQGGQTMARWADSKAACWNEADRRLKISGVSQEQVQVAWVKLANASPSGEFEEHGKQLERDTRVVLANLKQHFPNLQIAYLGSRIYGGYSDGRLNPEPYAYEGGFVVRWLIKSQANGDAELNSDAKLGDVKSPLLLWGPYFWADGITPRASDGLIWERTDLVNDGTHPSDTGRQKVAEQLLSFFKTDIRTREWFVKK